MPRTKTKGTTKRSTSSARNKPSGDSGLRKRVAELERRVSLLEAKQLEPTRTRPVTPSPLPSSDLRLESEPDLVHDIEKP